MKELDKAFGDTSSSMSITPASSMNPMAGIRMMQRTPEQEAEAQRRQEEYRRDEERQTELLHIALLASIGISKRHGLAIPSLQKIDRGPWFDAKEMLRQAVKDGLLIALLGGRGVGKTQMVACLIDEMLRGNVRNMRFLTAGDLFRLVRSTFSSKADTTEMGLIDDLSKRSLLCIDELHERASSDFESRTLTAILDRRYAEMRPTILISNETKTTFVEGIGVSIASRMIESGKCIECNWQSFRPMIPADLKSARDAAAKSEWSSNPAGLRKIYA